MTTRREVLRAALACATAAGGLRPATLNAGPAPPDWPLGVQLWSVNELLAGDFDGTLRALGELGVRRVEAAGWQRRSPADFRRAVEAAGMQCDGAHFSMDAMLADLDGVVGQTRDVGCTNLICASPHPPVPVPADVDWMAAIVKVMTLDAWKRNADLLNRAALKASAAGLTFGYHNHVADFIPHHGRRGYDVLLERTDPAQVRLELDVAWAVCGGQDPVALIEAHGARIIRLHLKDLKVRPRLNHVSNDYSTLPMGSGVIDWAPILSSAVAMRVAGAYLEVEPPHARPPLEELAMGRDYLARLRARA